MLWRHLRRRPIWWLVGVALVLASLAFVRPLDHDESQYVAATLLARHGLIYRDFAYLQTPLQPLLFAPFVGARAFIELRLFNALLAAGCIGFVYAASRRAGASQRNALLAAGLLACCDSFLFGAAVARNDMLPACLFAAALWLMVMQAEGRGAAGRAVAIGLLLSATTAAKLSYALPALVYGGLALTDHRHRPGWLLLGAVPPALLVAATWAGAPAAFAFDVLRFPTAAPEQYYAIHAAGKLGVPGRALDILKFLALGPALLASLVVLADFRRRSRLAVMLDVMIVAGLIAAILPAPTWRQYLLVMILPLFVRLSLTPTLQRPARGLRIAAAVFVVAGLVPSTIALVEAVRTRPPVFAAIAYSGALRSTMDRLHVTGPIATLSPQLIAPTERPIDPRFATGPFFFRSNGLLSSDDERRFTLISRANAAAQLWRCPPAAIVTGGEAGWTSGDYRLDAALAAIARRQGWTATAVPATPFTLFLPPSHR
ncbi:DUF2029 domain-containing protein [Hephaestia sp. GCM10023244]|uniref:DUF2029 domain-containing protein n=1 Tax=unclassified Hephaestia TaxID=2631281 RepID=UPI0020778FF3|nr:DUF2029 domain-containing protein [Hephaestia sp. MAHUQ-44]MCM8732525.1 DUF2029 domain-containing protein [Hephaestia sp. MAHUQ-44]